MRINDTELAHKLLNEYYYSQIDDERTRDIDIWCKERGYTPVGLARVLEFKLPREFYQGSELLKHYPPERSYLFDEEDEDEEATEEDVSPHRQAMIRAVERNIHKATTDELLNILTIMGIDVVIID